LLFLAFQDCVGVLSIAKWAGLKRALDFSIEFPPWEVVDYQVQNYDYFVNVIEALA
jgi:hypothetical protein